MFAFASTIKDPAHRCLLSLVLLCGVIVAVQNTAMADPPEIVEAKVVETAGSWRFDVTIKHPDTGWDHYADAFTVHAPDGSLLGERILHHPHVEEQPFTRSLSGVSIPENISSVEIRAKDNLGTVSTDNPTLKLPGR